MSTPDSLQQNPLAKPDASTKMKKNSSSRKSADLKTLFQSEPFSFTFPTLIHPEEPSRVIRAETDARPCSELCPAVVGSCCSKSLPLVPPSSGIMFRVDHDDKRTLSLHCPDSVAPGSSVTLYEKKSTGGHLVLFQDACESGALIYGPKVTSSSGSKKGHKMKVDSNGILIWQQSKSFETPYTVEWIEGFKEGTDLNVTYVEGICDVPEFKMIDKETGLANKEGKMKEATVGGEVRLSNGTKFRNPRKTPSTPTKPWIFDAKQKHVQRDLMMKDPREGAADQLVGWAAPLSDVKRYEAKMKSGETKTCVCHSVACVVCCPCSTVMFWLGSI
jgi:hypothetical protein